FTGLQYSQWQCNFVFASTLSQEFPDWEAFVRAFSVDACYISTTLGMYSPTALSRWNAINNFWNGSCFGIAAANALAFTHRNNFTNKFPTFPGFTDPISLTSNNNVIPVMSELFTHQFGNPTKQNRRGRWNTITPNESLNETKQMLLADYVTLRTLSIWNNNGGGGHNILPYELEQDNIQKELYYLYVYDNSYPSNSSLILIDTSGNSNKGTWLTTYAWSSWGGPKYLMLEVPAINYLSDAILPKRTEDYVSPFLMSGDDLDIYTNIGVNTSIVDGSGNVTGYVNGTIFNEIPNSIPLIYLNGSETPPYGYSLTTDNYSVQIDSVESDTLQTFFFTGNKTFIYERTGVTNTETDRLFFDGEMSAANPDQDNKSISLVNIINESNQEKLFALRQVTLVQNDSVKIENPDDNRMNFISFGSGGDFAALGLTIYVDEGNDGTIDDTLNVDNTVDVEDDQGSLIPTEYKLEQNYPNPFNPTTTIRYSIPEAGLVTLNVYNILGEEIATLVNEEKTAGNYEIEFDASNLSSGIYFYRIQTGSLTK
ncbi:MAG: T9SS type A sorting domain-containing protein, partial [Ignavibacteriaceae bacterium]